MKPKLNSYVWVKYVDNYGNIEFIKVRIIAKGSEIFVHDKCFDCCKWDDFRVPLHYDDYKCTWFKSLEEIKRYYKIKKIFDDSYIGILKGDKDEY